MVFRIYNRTFLYPGHTKPIHFNLNKSRCYNT